MEQIGKRSFYVITWCGDWDGINQSVVFITQNKKEAIKRFEYLYNVYVFNDYHNDAGEEMFEDRDYHIDTHEGNRRFTGYFWYHDYDGYYMEYRLQEIKTNCFVPNYIPLDGSLDRVQTLPFEQNYKLYLDTERNGNQ